MGFGDCCGQCCDSCPGECCFPGSGNSVITLKGEQKYVEDLREGDMARVIKEDGTLGYSKVWGFGHQNPDKKAKFYQIDVESHRLTISPRHYLYREEDGTMTSVMAKDVQVGDSLYILDDEEEITTEKVVKIETVEGKGIYAPFTKSGLLVVNHVLVSCYAEVEPSTAHKAMAPLRGLHTIAPKRVFDKVMTQNKDGVPKILNSAFKACKPWIAKA